MNEMKKQGFEQLKQNGIFLSEQDVFPIIERYSILEFSIFGSVLRSDFNEQSDLDLLIEFKDNEKISLLDIIEIQEYFEKLTLRKVDIVEPASLKNPYRRNSILSSKVPLYVA